MTAAVGARSLAFLALAAGWGSACDRSSKSGDRAPRALEPFGPATVIPPEGTLYTSREDHFSTHAPGGWTALREAGAVVFTESVESGRHPSTVFVQTAPIEGEWIQKRTPEFMLAATERAIRALPKAKVTGPRAVQHAGMMGAELGVTYVPPAARGRRYDRRHVVLMGKQHVFHVVATSPAGDLEDAAAAFATVLGNLKEEG